MKTKKLVSFVGLLALTSAFSLQPSVLLHAAPLGTAFTHQGRLNDGGNPANGSYDLRFVLYTADVGGSQVGPILTNSAVAASNGLFATTLDFGDGAFTGDARWLEVAVCTNGAGSFITLTPRQALTPAPQALYAPNAGTAATASSVPAANLTGTIPDARLAANVARLDSAQSFIGANTFGNAGNSFTGNGYGLTSLNADNLGNGTVPDLRLSANIPRLDDNQTFSGNNVFSSANNSFSGIGSGLTSLNADQISSGTLPGGRLSGLYSGSVNFNNGANSFSGSFSGNGAGLTSLNAGGIGSGTLSDTRLSANVAMLNSVQTFTGAKSFSVAPSFTAVIGAPFSVSSGTMVSGLNVDYLDGMHASAFAPYTHTHSAADLATGTLSDARLSSNVSLLGQSVESAEITDGTIVTADIGSIDAGKIVGGDLLAARLKVGTNHTLSGTWATIAGGSNNAATYPFAAVGGGQENHAAGNYATVAGGVSNYSWGASTTIGGGICNTNSGYNYATIAGGFKNSVGDTYGFIGGGYNNSATGTLATVVGGDSNVSGGSCSAVGGGRFNLANGYRATVAGGYSNHATNYYSTVGGGYQNTVWGYGATIPGGYLNVAVSNYSFAAGYRAKAWHAGAFVWGDMTNNDASSTNANSMTFRASGGVRIFTISDQSAGVYLAPNGTSWSAMSDRNAKKNFRPVDAVAVLDKLAAIPISQWNYEWEQDNDVPNIGPMAQDFKAAFFPGRDDKSITTLEFDGVELAAIQGLNQKLEEKNATLEKRVAELTDMVKTLAAKVNGGGL